MTCHGASGKGDGAAAAALPPPKPADWTSAKVQAETDGELFWKITNGRGAMPPWKHLPEKDRWELVNYIRTLEEVATPVDPIARRPAGAPGGAFVSSTAMRLATIDLGSNTVRLLVADVEPGARGLARRRERTSASRAWARGSRRPAASAPRRPSARPPRVVEYVARARAAPAPSTWRSWRRARCARRPTGPSSSPRSNAPPASASAWSAARRRRALTLRRRPRRPRPRAAARRHHARLRHRRRQHRVRARAGRAAVAARQPPPRRGAISPSATRSPAPVDRPRYAGAAARRSPAGSPRELPGAIQAARVDRLVGTAGTVTTLAALDLGAGHLRPGARPGPHAARAAASSVCSRGSAR